MSTEASPLRRRSRPHPARSPAHVLAVVLAALIGTLASGRGVNAQIPVDDETRVRSVHFSGNRALTQRELRGVIETRDQGAWFGLRSLVGRLPLVPSPVRRYFSPLELQRDVVRLRDHYAEAGFRRAEIRYQAELDEARNLLDIRFVVEEGPPLRVSGVTIIGVDSLLSEVIPGDRQSGWRAVAASARGIRGQRLSVSRVRRQRDQLRRWWQDRGYPATEVRATLETDSLAERGRVAFIVSPGEPAAFGPITIEGERTLSDASIRRELPFHENEPYSAAHLEEARVDLEELEIVRLASLEVGLPSSDSLTGRAGPARLPVRVRIVEGRPRYVSGEVGYVSDAGLSGETRWSHRNVDGGGRTFTVSALAQSGLLAFADDPDKRYRGAVSLLQPHVLHRRVSTVLSPYVERRDDRQDRTLEFGTHATLITRTPSGQSATLDYRLARRHIYEYRLGNVVSGRTDLFTLITLGAQGILDSLGTTLTSSLFTLAGNLSRLDRLDRPTRGLILRPALQLTAPSGFSSTEYWQADGALHGFVPLTRGAVLAGRIKLGRMFPFGKSRPASAEEASLKLLQLSDVLFTAGGSGDVRGWESRLLGPKFPDLRFRESGDSLIVESRGYVPIGGLARMSFSVELSLPFPGFGDRLGTHFFLDGGRIWNPDRRFGAGDDPLGMRRTFYAAGAGVDVFTPVGPIKLGMGYKLNPSILDVVDSGVLFDALVAGQPLEELPRRQSRRRQFYLSIGSSF